MKFNGKNISSFALVLFSILLAALMGTVAQRQWQMYAEIKANEAALEHHDHSEITDESAR